MTRSPGVHILLHPFQVRDMLEHADLPELTEVLGNGMDAAKAVEAFRAKVVGC